MRTFLGISTIILLLLVIILAIALGWLIFTRQPYEEPFRPDAPQYGQRGDYAVGVQSFTIQDENRALNAWVWYPAEGEQELENYTAFNGMFETSGRANWDANPANDAAYPLVIFSHGNGSSPLLSLFYTEHLASHGFVVIGMEHTGNTMIDRIGPGDAYSAAIIDNYVHRPRDVSRAIDYALDELNTGVLSGMINPDQIAVSGHSFGGYTTFASAGASLNFDALASYCEENDGVTIGDLRDEIALTSANRDSALVGGVCGLQDDAPRMAELAGYDDVPSGAWESFSDERINSIIALAPFNAPVFGEESLAEIDIPTLILVGGNDNVTLPERDARNFYDWSGSETKYLAEFALADHYIFNDNCVPLLYNFDAHYACSDPVWDLTRAHDLINHLATAFLLSTYYNDSEAATALEIDNVDFSGITMQSE